MTTIPWLTILWAIPVVGAALIIVLPASLRHFAKYAGVVVSLAVLALSLLLAVRFDPAGTQFQFVENHPWIPSFGTGYILGLDGIALALVVLTAVLMPLLLIAGWNDADDRPGLSGRAPHSYIALMLAVEGMVMMSLVALDILLFYVFFEAMLIPMYFLIGGFGGENRSKAAVKFLLYNLFGGLIMLAAVIGLYVVTSASKTFDAGTFDFRAIADAVATGAFTMQPGVANALFLGFMFAFAVKAPLWPFHRWLPDAAVQATPASAVLMMAVMDKVGTFGMLRYCLPLFPDSATYFRPVIIALAVIGIVYGAILAIGQTDVMRLIAYTSISHFGFIILGIFVMTSQGQAGSTLYMVNHGISTAALFLIAGFLVSQRGSRVIADYGGIQKVAPILAGTFLIAGLATLSLPGLAPFISEFLVLIGTFTRYPAFAVIASAALVLSAVYILWMYQRMMTGSVTDGNEKVRDLRPRELLVVAPLIALLIGLGIYPKVALDVINPAVTATLTSIHQPDPAPTVAEGTRP
ncbi:NADH-quinone oxidoreductase subunit M [Mycolicibacterium sp. BK556]|uniref:NADH-quinone oxidoreductase subunit M n=1 Tax=unclassified Mycolicibacterium TaxID=2636767 RepID=UPI0016224B25|nr:MULTISPECIES: NADH-quinone oxidoreductase subunit M [unclassified Mycolicibacterium]MBB3602711.1 NADH-quinone oxidoreductase subunit M [Mycolicibacterium sp. BK556]MBB3632463.1 NADH-quinone oxidoreductase subunit M [Mycolicibacterium sp. BK607]MBB3750496.1 NADH-quinone oxidoreductase subunit M [Mycolicibacterium sp. BK634]